MLMGLVMNDLRRSYFASDVPAGVDAGGGPGRTTEFLSLYLYRIAFRFFDLGQASALAVIVMAFMIALYTVISRFLPAETR